METEEESFRMYRKRGVKGCKPAATLLSRFTGTGECKGDIRPHDDNPSIVPVFKPLAHKLNCFQIKKNYIYEIKSFDFQL
jgi:hypothetical protein